MKKMFCAIILLLSSQVLAEEKKSPATTQAVVPAAPAVVEPATVTSTNAVAPVVAPEKDSLLDAAKEDLKNDKKDIKVSANSAWEKTKAGANKAKVAMSDSAKKAGAKVVGWWTSVKATSHRLWTSVKSWF